MSHVWIGDHFNGSLAGYAAALITESLRPAQLVGASIPIVDGIACAHLGDGDVVAVHASGYVRTLYRRNSPHNAIFATDRCNSYCVMCSQPPKDVDDTDRIAEHLRLVDLIDPSTSELGITGGEPTLLKDDLIQLLRHCKVRLPSTALHVLSNGRLFRYGSFARAVANVSHPDLTFGIPIYSDLDYLHDYVVQCKGAFDDTVVGLQNLGRYHVNVEIRVVVHRLTCERLPEIAAFIYRNLPFAVHVALMGLEPMGFAAANIRDLWIDPWAYRERLEAAVRFLDDRGMAVSIYNHQLCAVPSAVRGFCRRSISDWKNAYLPACAPCSARSECGGFFASSIQRRVLPTVRPFVTATDID